MNVTTLAVALKHFDKSRAAGLHYSGAAAQPMGSDGVFRLDDGRRVFGLGSGTLAPRADIDPDRIVPIPDALDDATAAALPNAVIGSAMALLCKAGIQPGDVVLVNGATGFTGRVAVQLAKHYGAARVIATGRTPQTLKDADEFLPTTDPAFAARVKAADPDIILDYLWGPTAEAILSALTGDGRFTKRRRYVSIGSVTGDKIALSAATLRSTDLQLTGSGLGAWSKAQVQRLFTDILPEAFDLAASGQLQAATTTIALADLSTAGDPPPGVRVVVTL